MANGGLPMADGGAHRDAANSSSTLFCRPAPMPVYPRTCIPLYLSPPVPVYQCTSMPMYLSTCLPVYLCTSYLRPAPHSSTGSAPGQRRAARSAGFAAVGAVSNRPERVLGKSRRVCAVAQVRPSGCWFGGAIPPERPCWVENGTPTATEACPGVFSNTLPGHRWTGPSRGVGPHQCPMPLPAGRRATNCISLSGAGFVAQETLSIRLVAWQYEPDQKNIVELRLATLSPFVDTRSAAGCLPFECRDP